MTTTYQRPASFHKAVINHRITEPTTQHDMSHEEWRNAIAANGRTNRENFLFWCNDDSDDDDED